MLVHDEAQTPGAPVSPYDNGIAPVNVTSEPIDGIFLPFIWFSIYF